MVYRVCSRKPNPIWLHQVVPHGRYPTQVRSKRQRQWMLFGLASIFSVKNQKPAQVIEGAFLGFIGLEKLRSLN